MHLYAHPHQTKYRTYDFPSSCLLYLVLSFAVLLALQLALPSFLLSLELLLFPLLLLSFLLFQFLSSSVLSPTACLDTR